MSVAKSWSRRLRSFGGLAFSRYHMLQFYCSRQLALLFLVHSPVWVYGRCKTVNTRALYRSFVSSSFVSGGFIVFLCFNLYGVTGDRFKLHMIPSLRVSDAAQKYQTI